MTGRRIARVVLDSPLPQLDRLFDYAVPDRVSASIREGVRVRVPLRVAGRVVDAFVVELAIERDPARALSEIETVVSEVPVLPRRLYDLARRLADRAAGSAIDILRLAVARRMVRAERAWQAGEPAAPPRVDGSAAAWARECLDAVPGLTDDLDGGGRVALSAPVGMAARAGAAPIARWAELLAAAAVHTLAGGRSSVLVVPDHRDLDQLDAALAHQEIDRAVIRLDAEHSGPNRYRAYLRVLEPAPVIVIGNRSAVYAPVHDLGLIALWDDGDPMLREPLTPGVHARDAALVRQEQEGGALLLAGHTRTTDVERLVALDWLRSRGGEPGTGPKVVLTPVREGEFAAARIPSAAYAAAREGLNHGPVLIQVARPGYAHVLSCAQCRAPARCSTCAGPLHARTRGAVPVCRWCARRADDWKCPTCTGESFRLLGSGTQRTAEELGRAFPGIRVIIADSDHPVAAVGADHALVIATRGAEPLSPRGYAAVLLLDGERMLLADDLRIGEHCLRWWSNAAALAAPGAPVHLVGVAGGLGRALASWTQPAYARSELQERAPLRMPPAVRVAALEGSRQSVEAALASLGADVPSLRPDSVLGPVSAGETWRALVRFDYHEGAAVTAGLRAAVVADALRSRRGSRSRGSAPRNTLRVRLDLADLTLEDSA